MPATRDNHDPMSVDYRFFLRDQPNLDVLSAGVDEDDRWWANELRRAEGGAWQFGGMTLTHERYSHRGVDDAIVPARWRDEVRWVLDADGRLGDVYDEWLALVEAVCTRWKGACYSQQLDAFVRDFPPSGTLEATDDPMLSREHLALLIDRAPADTAAMAQLERGPANTADRSVFGELFTALLLERARAGAQAQPWQWALARLQYSSASLGRTQLRELTSGGSLGKAIAKHYQRRFSPALTTGERKQRSAKLASETTERDARNNALLDKRRRAGELFAGVPDDIRALAQHDRTAAVAEYARRYDLSEAQARKVIDANV